MNLPGEQHWLRVEELGEQLRGLPPAQAAAQISQLAANGESPTVLTLLGTWLELPPLPRALAAGDGIGGRYTLVEKIGHGGMGTVWRARQDLIGREVALKMIHPELVTPKLQARFLAEIETLGRLDHPGIARIFDAGFHEQTHGPPVPFFAMELVPGLPLNLWAADHRRDRGALSAVAVALCDAVQSAHERRIVHRDLKPSNLLVKGNGQPVVLDFGIARLAGVIIGDEPGLFSGTLAYAAPEQHLGCDGDFRSGESVDVFALGAILFEMFSGRRLFTFPSGASFAEMRRIVLEEKVPRLAEVLADCPPLLDEVVNRAVCRDPADRFYSMVALGRAVRRATGSGGAAAAASVSWVPAAGKIVPGTQWRLLEKIGEGGTGQVWRGQHEQLGERRVFKFCDSEEKVRTLKRELTLYHLLKGQVGLNPHFIPLHEVSLDEPPWYLMMDEVHALALGQWAQQQAGGVAALPEATRLEIVAQAAEALQAAHEAGILHRDVKPENLLVKSLSETGGVHVYVTDFGIGQLLVEELLREGPRPGFTRTVSRLSGTSVSGTLLYLAPEVLEGKAATIRSDIYSLGVVLWQMLSGNLHAALDPADWPARIEDPLLREDLARCLAGSPEKRWSSAGELAAQLRDLPRRRAAAAARRQEVAERERAAYRRGVMKTAVFALALLLIFAGIAAVAWVQRERARRAGGEIALRQAAALKQTDFFSGRRARGLALLETAADTTTNAGALRTAAAAVFKLDDVVLEPTEHPKTPPEPTSQVGPQPHEVARAFSHDGKTIAVARDLDGVNGIVDLFDPDGTHLGAISRGQFPWLPVAEGEMLRFSPNDRLLAVGGSATSRHILICNVAEKSVITYLFHGSDPLCCAWYGNSRFLAVGCADGTVRIWDVTAGVRHAGAGGAGGAFDLPPVLDVPAEDEPRHILDGQSGPVLHLAFSPNGRWLTVLDATGCLRVYTCFFPGEDSPLGQAGPSDGLAPAQSALPPVFSLETRISAPTKVTELAVEAERIIIRREDGTSEALRLVSGDFPVAAPILPGIREIAWNSRGTDFCAMSLTDLYWFKVSPLELVRTWAGQNPVGIGGAGQDDEWWVAKDRMVLECSPGAGQSTQVIDLAMKAGLMEAVAGQASRTALAAAGDGRIAVYCGRRIQFFDRHGPAPLDTSLIADGGGGTFKQIIWDERGRLLGVTFVLSGGNTRLEAWETSSNFPPQCVPCPVRFLDCDRIEPANDGRHLIARGGRRGLWELVPLSGRETSLDASSSACQDGPFAASADGSLLGFVADHSTIRLLELPSGKWFADFAGVRPAGLEGLWWSPSSRYLVSLTNDGLVELWNLGPWQFWLSAHGLQR